MRGRLCKNLLKGYSPFILLIFLFAETSPEMAFPVFTEVEQCRNKSDSAIFYKYLYNKWGKSPHSLELYSF